MANIPHILLIYTGGTIGMVKDYKTGALRTFNFNELNTGTYFIKVSTTESTVKK